MLGPENVCSIWQWQETSTPLWHFPLINSINFLVLSPLRIIKIIIWLYHNGFYETQNMLINQHVYPDLLVLFFPTKIWRIDIWVRPTSFLWVMSVTLLRPINLWSVQKNKFCLASKHSVPDHESTWPHWLMTFSETLLISPGSSLF